MNFASIARHTQVSLKAALVNELKQKLYKPIVRDGFIYAKGELPILLVAHLDTVHRTPVKTICYSSDGKIIMSPEGIGGDDRAGVFMILEIIKSHRCHVLFCEDEERGGIGATKFSNSTIKPKVNFIVELDRRGSNDAVFYDCDNPEFTKHITSFGFEEEFGSFSDISIIAPELGIAAVNISAGYFNEHTTHEHVDLGVIRNNIERVGKLVSTESDTFKYIETRRYQFRLGRFSDYKYYGIDYDEYEEDEKEEAEVIETKRLMELYSPYYVTNPDHEMVECDGDFYIDADGKVYEMNKYLGYAVEADGYQAFREHGLPAIFIESYADWCEVISEDTAFRMECRLL